MNNNTKLSLADLTEAILNDNIDFGDRTEAQKLELLAAAQNWAEQNRINAEYLEPAEAFDNSEAKAIAADQRAQQGEATNVGCTTLVDSAFTSDCPPSGQLEKRGDTLSEKAHYDDDDPIQLSSEDDDDDQSLELNDFSKEEPANGNHDRCVLSEYPTKIAGKNGNSDYRIFRIRDLDAKIEWRKFVSEDDLRDVLSDINVENHKLLTVGGRKSTRDFLTILQEHSWRCWTVQNLQGKTCTYFRLEGKGGYKGFCYFLSMQAEEKEKQAQKYGELKAQGAQKSFVPAQEDVAKPWEK